MHPQTWSIHRNGCTAAEAAEHSMVMAGVFIPDRLNRLRAGRRVSPPLVFGACLAVSLFVSSCATPYEPLDHHFGYSEKQVGNDVYEVSFVGNGNSSYQRVLDFAMLRAAEIALNHHAKSFVVLDVINRSSARSYLTAPQFYWTTAGGLYRGGPDLPPSAAVLDWNEHGYLVMEPAQEGIYYRPGVMLKVKLLPDPPGSYYPYDPAKVSEQLRRKYGIRLGKQ
jgi:hypothetical protein